MKNPVKHLFVMVPMVIIYLIAACSQEPSMKHLELKDMSSFDKQNNY